MNLQEIYRQKASEPTPKQKMLEDLVKATGRSYDTVLSWCLGRRKPSGKDKHMVADALGVDIKELFPQ